MMKSVGDGESWTKGDEIVPRREHAGSQGQRQHQDSPKALAVHAHASRSAQPPRNSAPASLHDLPIRTSPLKLVRNVVCDCCRLHVNV